MNRPVLQDREVISSLDHLPMTPNIVLADLFGPETQCKNVFKRSPAVHFLIKKTAENGDLSTIILIEVLTLFSKCITLAVPIP